MASQASAILLTDPDLVAGDSYNLGVVVPGHPAGDAEYETYVNTLAGLEVGDYTIDDQDYTRYAVYPSPLPPADYDTRDESGSDSFDVEGMVYLYVVAKYDADKGGLLVWYNPDGFTGDIKVPDSYGGTEVSNIAVFNGTPVPEASTLMLFGVGLVFLAGIRRKAIFNKR